MEAEASCSVPRTPVEAVISCRPRAMSTACGTSFRAISGPHDALEWVLWTTVGGRCPLAGRYGRKRGHA